MLNQNSLLSSVKIEKTTQYGAVTWNWARLDNWAGGAATYYLSDEVLRYIDVYIYTDIKFADVKRSYGEPTHIIVNDETSPEDTRYPSYGIILAYLDYGFYVITNIATEADFTDAMGINHVTFFDTSEKSKGKGPWNPDEAVPWEGLRDLGYYCQQLVSCGKAPTPWPDDMPFPTFIIPPEDR